jgi:single-stranded-DNA-specific exonuclease
VKLAEVNGGLMKEIELLEPLGFGNPEPLLGAKDLEVVGPRVVGSRHLKMKLKKGQYSFDTIGFDMGSLIGTVDQAAVFDAVFTPAYNDWNGNRYLQLVLKGLRPSS